MHPEHEHSQYYISSTRTYYTGSILTLLTPRPTPIPQSVYTCGYFLVQTEALLLKSVYTMQHSFEVHKMLLVNCFNNNKNCLIIL